MLVEVLEGIREWLVTWFVNNVTGTVLAAAWLLWLADEVFGLRRKKPHDRS